MLAARYYSPRDVRLEDVERPSAGEGELVLKVMASDMCGTDLKTYLRGHPLMVPPSIMGHEYSGRVHEVGKGVTRFKKGDAVVASNSAPCGACEMCRRGSLSLCEVTKRELIGFSLQGSHAEYVLVPKRIVAKNAYKFKSVTPAEIAAAEPLASVIHAMGKVGPVRGKTVAVIGAGALGLMFLQLLKRAGAKVIIVNRSPGRLDLAEKLGADRRVQADDSTLVTAVRRATGGVGPDLVVEAAGRKETWERSFLAARDGGRVLMFGGCASGTVVSFDAGKIHYGETSLVGSFHHEPASFRKAVEAIQSGRVKVAPLLTTILPLRKIIEGFHSLEDRSSLKVTLEP
jgi:L-iditol 2-dehydrogenase